VYADATEGSSAVSGVVTSLTLDANGQYHFRTDTNHGRPAVFAVRQYCEVFLSICELFAVYVVSGMSCFIDLCLQVPLHIV